MAHVHNTPTPRKVKSCAHLSRLHAAFPDCVTTDEIPNRHKCLQNRVVCKPAALRRQYRCTAFTVFSTMTRARGRHTSSQLTTPSHFEDVCLCTKWKRRKAMSNDGEVVLTLDELAFALLLSSHDIFCRVLSDVVKNRIKHFSPDSWIAEICRCFSSHQAEHIRKDLGEDGSGGIHDAFVLCKIIRSFMHRVFSKRPAASGCGYETVLGPMEMERFTFQLHDVEGARHLAFHGRGVSVDETVRSMISMRGFLSTFFRVNVNKDTFGQHFLTCRQQLSDKIDLLRRTKEETPSVVGLPLQNIFQALLYRCISTLEVEMSRLLKDIGQRKYEDAFDIAKSAPEISSLLMMIKREAGLPPATSCLKNHLNSRPNFLASLQKLGKLFSSGESSVRNKLAHGKSLKCEEIEAVLESTESFLNSLKNQSSVASTGCLWPELRYGLNLKEMTSKESGLFRCEVLDRRNVPALALRATCLVKTDRSFVGRDVDLDRAVKTLKDLSRLGSEVIREVWSEITLAFQCTPTIVILGAAGVGKSTLARRIVAKANDIFNRQSWICADNTANLQSGLLSSVLSGQRTGDESLRTRLDSLPHRELIVLDNLRKQCVPLVTKLFIRSQHVLVITSHSERSICQIFAEGFEIAQQINLVPFGHEESLKLVRSHVRLNFEDSTFSSQNHDREGFWRDVGKVVTEDLGNLPLAVNTFGVLLQRAISARAIKKKRLKVEMAQQALLAVREKLNNSWEILEQECEDSFHVRGLSGMVNIALQEINDNPQALLFFFAGALSATATFPWADIKKLPCYGRFPCPENLSPAESMVCFSILSSAMESLIEAGSTHRKAVGEVLQDLGMVEISEPGEKIHVHQLIQKLVCHNLTSEASSVTNLLPSISTQTGIRFLTLWLLVIITEMALNLMRDGEAMLCTTMDLESVNFSPIQAFLGLFKQVSLETLPLTLRWKVAFLGAMTEEDSDLALCLMNDALHCLLNPKLTAEGWFESSGLFSFFVAEALHLLCGRAYSLNYVRNLAKCVKTLKCFSDKSTERLVWECADAYGCNCCGSDSVTASLDM